MTAPNTNPTPERRIIGPLIGAGAIVVFLAICLFAYLTFEPDPVEDGETEGTAVQTEDAPDQEEDDEEADTE